MLRRFFGQESKERKLIGSTVFMPRDNQESEGGGWYRGEDADEMADRIVELENEGYECWDLHVESGIVVDYVTFPTVNSVAIPEACSAGYTTSTPEEKISELFGTPEVRVREYKQNLRCVIETHDGFDLLVCEFE